METLETLAEDACGAVSVFLEFDSCFPLKLAAPVIIQGKCHREYPHEFINPAAFRHVSILELFAKMKNCNYSGPFGRGERFADLGR
jgi:hypothetical protein